ncbi:hypothetical protein EDD86DRAFT_196996 [Gorgonomyces haynaldii]|nr:hypothetical protein EDD86DRAFT_196996 [Gorgonomyces haynaldii]
MHKKSGSFSMMPFVLEQRKPKHFRYHSANAAPDTAYQAPVVDLNVPFVLPTSKQWCELDGRSVDIAKAQLMYKGTYDQDKGLYTIDPSCLDKNQIHRQEVIWEMLTTEADYLQDLRIVSRLCDKLIAGGVLTKKDAKLIFSNLDDLITVSQKFISLMMLRKREDVGVFHRMSDIMFELAQDLKIYHVYCSNYSRAVDFLEQTRQDPDFSRVMQVFTMGPEFRKLDIGSFLLKPVQRICKYPLMIKELTKSTPADDPEHKELNNAIEVLSEVLTFVNLKQGEAEARKEMYGLLNRIEFIEKQLPPNNNRMLIHHGVLQKQNIKSNIVSFNSMRLVLLLTDCLVLAKAPLFSGGKHVASDIVSIWSLSVVDIPDTEKSKFVMGIRKDSKRAYNLIACSQQEKDVWMQHFRSTTSNANQELANSPVAGDLSNQRRIISETQLQEIPRTLSDSDLSKQADPLPFKPKTTNLVKSETYGGHKTRLSMLARQESDDLVAGPSDKTFVALNGTVLAGEPFKEPKRDAAIGSKFSTAKARDWKSRVADEPDAAQSRLSIISSTDANSRSAMDMLSAAKSNDSRSSVTDNRQSVSSRKSLHKELQPSTSEQRFKLSSEKLRTSTEKMRTSTENLTLSGVGYKKTASADALLPKPPSTPMPIANAESRSQRRLNRSQANLAEQPTIQTKAAKSIRNLAEQLTSPTKKSVDKENIPSSK